jgi:hypothetical protein
VTQQSVAASLLALQQSQASQPSRAHSPGARAFVHPLSLPQPSASEQISPEAFFAIMDDDFDNPHHPDNNPPSHPPDCATPSQPPAKKASSQQPKTGKSNAKVANQPSATPQPIREHLKRPAESELEDDDTPASTPVRKLKQKNPKAAKELAIIEGAKSDANNKQEALMMRLKNEEIRLEMQKKEQEEMAEERKRWMAMVEKVLGQKLE